MKQVFIKVQSSVGQSWADAIESINAYSVGLSDDPVQSLKNERNYDQKANVYTQIANLIKLSPTGDGNFTVQIAVPRGEDGIKTINMSEAFTALTPSNGSYESVQYGYIFEKEGKVKDVEVIENSRFFARDPDSKRFVDAITGEELSDSDTVEMAVWLTMYRVSGTHIYYMIVNPNLLAVSEDLSGKFEDARYYHLNTRDGTFRNKVFAPTIKGGSLVGDNIIVATEDTVEIDTFGLSMLHYDSGDILPENIPPKIEMVVNSSLPVSRESSVITVDVSDKNIGTLTYQWITRSYLDSSLTGNESLKYSFVIIKE